MYGIKSISRYLLKIALAKISQLSIKNKLLTRVRHYKFLGIHIDENLSWEKHILETANKISKVNGLLSKLKHFFPSKTLLLIYNSLILSRINYGLLIWGFGKCERLITIQKKAIRNVSRAHFFAHSLPLFRLQNTLSFQDLFSSQCLKFLYKCLHHSLPSYFLNPIFIKTNQTNTSKYNLRTSSSIAISDFIIEPVNYRPQNLVPKTKKTVLYETSFTFFASSFKHLPLSKMYF